MNAVGFDLDGTLIDSTDAIVASFVHAYRMLGLDPPPRDRIVATIRVPLEDMFRQLGAPDIEQLVTIYRDHYVREAPATTTILPGVPQALSDLKTAGFAIGIATSKKRTSAQVLLEYFGLAHHFACCIGPEDVTRAKPDPEPILALAACLGANLNNFVYVGDTVLDVQAAHAAGVQCCAVTTGYDSRAELEAAGASAIFDNIEHVTKYVLSAGGSLG